jgi:hypothetical protein
MNKETSIVADYSNRIAADGTAARQRGITAEYNHHTPMSNKISPLRTFKRAAVITPLLLCFLFAPRPSAQISPGQNRPTPAEAEMEAEQKHAAEKALNTKRQQDIKKDTDKLLDLATELKEYVDKSNENTLSLDVIKKADAIEKLAHTVKEKMKGP